MKKITKGVIALSAAATLLLSTGGTMAFWNETANVGGAGSLSAGNLLTEQVTAGAWQLEDAAGVMQPVADINTLALVPGDKLTFSSTYKVTGQGTNLYAKATLSGGAITAQAGDASTALATVLTANATQNMVVQDADPNGLVDLRSALGTNIEKTVTVTTTIEWPYGVEADNTAKTGAVDLSEFAVTFVQVNDADTVTP